VHRSRLNPAHYNPRTIDVHSRKKLKDTIRRGGLVENLVWNKRTGRLVGGHQRLSILDELEEGADYALEVCVVDVDEKTEKTLNIALNNPGMQGDWNTDVLAALVPELDVDMTGFDRLDLESLLPDLDLGALFSDAQDSPDLKKDAKTLEEIKAERKRFKEQGAKKNDAGFMLHVVFGSGEESARFRKRAGVERDAEYVDGRRLATNMGIDLDQGD
jgi:hypothetical protein